MEPNPTQPINQSHVTIQSTSHICEPDGTLIPCFRYRMNQHPDTVISTKVLVPITKNSNCIAPGDVVDISYLPDAMDLRVADRAENRKREIALEPDVCPYCGSVLVSPSVGKLRKRCISAVCPAQIRHNITRFISSLPDPNLSHSERIILNTLIARCEFHTVCDLYLKDLVAIVAAKYVDEIYLDDPCGAACDLTVRLQNARGRYDLSSLIPTLLPHDGTLNEMDVQHFLNNPVNSRVYNTMYDILRTNSFTI